MEADLSRPSRRAFLYTLLILIGVATGFIFVFSSSTPPAHAAENTSCGQAVCYVSSTVLGESDWATEPYTSSDGTVAQPRSGTQPKFITKYVGCGSWHNPGTGKLVFSYPAQDSGTYNCFITGKAIADACPPAGDRASNGRVDYFVERVRADGSTVWVFARFKCLYPTDVYFLPRIERGKIYTGGQGDFYQTPDGNQAQQATRTGNRTDTTGYIDRGVDLTNPEAWAGSWQPEFTARTGTTSAGAPLYGYYRLLWVLDFRMCVKTIYPAWLGEPPIYDCGERGQDTYVQPYTYACDTNPPLQGGIRWGALFSPSDCVPAWQCFFTGEETVGGSLDGITAMRNGQPIPTTARTPNVQNNDPSRLRNVRNWQTYRTITPGSTPDSRYVKASWNWERWETYSPSGSISFNWASESASQPFSWSTKYRFTADFLVPKQDTHTGAVSYIWVSQSRECLDTTSPTVAVQRATNR